MKIFWKKTHMCANFPCFGSKRLRIRIRYWTKIRFQKVVGSGTSPGSGFPPSRRGTKFLNVKCCSDVIKFGLVRIALWIFRFFRFRKIKRMMNRPFYLIIYTEEEGLKLQHTFIIIHNRFFNLVTGLSVKKAISSRTACLSATKSQSWNF